MYIKTGLFYYNDFRDELKYNSSDIFRKMVISQYNGNGHNDLLFQEIFIDLTEQLNDQLDSEIWNEIDPVV